MKIEMNGVFRLLTSEGTEVPLPGKQGPALLAILATSRHCQRSRDFLKAMLWPRAEEPQSSANLRALLCALRRSLGPHAHILVAERGRIRLQAVETTDEVDERHEFFEDAPALGEEFEDWLTQERARVRNAPRPCNAKGNTRLRIALQSPDTSDTDPCAVLLAARFVDQVMQGLRRIEAVDVIDCSIDPTGPSAPADIAVKLTVAKAGHCAELGMRMFEPETGVMRWNDSLAIEAREVGALVRAQIDAFARHGTDAVRDALRGGGDNAIIPFRRPERSRAPGAAPRLSRDHPARSLGA